MLRTSAANQLIQLNRLLQRSAEFTKFLNETAQFLPASRRPMCFISYAWEDNSTQAGRDSNEAWHKKLSRIKNDLERLGAKVFLDIYNMHGHMPAQMKDNIEKSDFIILIGTPRLMARLNGPRPTNVKFEWGLIKEKMRLSPHCLIPLLFEGSFATAFPAEVSNDQLVLDMSKDDAHEPIMANLANPLGIIPNIFGIHHMAPTDLIMQRYRTSSERLELAFRQIDSSIHARQPHELEPELHIQSNEITVKGPLDNRPMTEVYLAQCRGHLVRVKCLRITTAAERNEFIREAKIMGRLRHPHIVTLYGACLEASHESLVVEHSDQVSLARRLETAPLPKTLQHKIATEIASALSYLHCHPNQIFHGDLRTENIVLNDKYEAKLTGFGFSETNARSISSPTVRSASLEWMAPEILRGEANTTQSDVYSYGMILWSILTDKHPRAGITYDNIPVNYANIIRACLSDQPNLRPTAQVLVSQLNSFQSQTNAPIVVNYRSNGNIAAETLVERALVEKKNGRLDKAFKLFLQAAQLNHVGAKAHIGSQLVQGKGVTQDETAGFGWLLDAAQHGHPRSMYNVGLMYEKGEGTVRDMNQARRWYLEACAQTSEPEVAEYAKKKHEEMSRQVGNSVV